MGCTSSLDQISQYKSQLSRKILQRISHLKSKQLIPNIGRFLPSEELRDMQYSANATQQTINISQIHRFQAGQNYLLSQERRLIWKIAIFQHYQQDLFKDRPFSQSPSAINDMVSKRFYEIQLDVNRTFPTINQLNRKDLKITLQNLTIYFQGVGYTQGMNFHVGFLLLCGFTCQQAYQIFIRLSYNKNYLLIRNFTQNFLNVNTCIKAMEHAINCGRNDSLKQVLARIQEFGMSLFIFVFSWFLSYFLYNFNIRSSVLIWDYLLLHTPSCKIKPEHNENPQHFGDSIFGHGFLNLINLSLHTIEQLSSKLVQCQDLEAVMQILRHDQIQKHLNEPHIEQIVLKAKKQSYVTQQMFKQVIQKEDVELSNIYKYKKEKDQQNYHIQFLNRCRYPRRVVKVASKKQFS